MINRLFFLIGMFSITLLSYPIVWNCRPQPFILKTNKMRTRETNQQTKV